jgi:hypothetical protein
LIPIPATTSFFQLSNRKDTASYCKRSMERPLGFMFTQTVSEEASVIGETTGMKPLNWIGKKNNSIALAKPFHY